MPIELKGFLIVIILTYSLVVLRMLYKKKLNLQYTLLWIFIGIVMLIITIFPQIIGNLALFIGIEVVSNMVFLLAGIFSLMLILYLTYIVSFMNERIIRISQMTALSEKRIRDLENKKERIANEADCQDN